MAVANECQLIAALCRWLDLDLDLQATAAHRTLEECEDFDINGVVSLVANLRMTAEDWSAHVDPESGHTYYYNQATEETTWDKPDEFHLPQVSMLWPRSLRSTMYIALAAGSDLYDVLASSRSHGLRALQMIRGLREIRRETNGSFHPESRQLTQLLCVGYVGFAAIHVMDTSDDDALGWTSIADALERAEELAKCNGELVSRRAELELRVWIASVRYEAAVARGEMESATELAGLALELELLIGSMPSTEKHRDCGRLHVACARLALARMQAGEAQESTLQAAAAAAAAAVCDGKGEGGRCTLYTELISECCTAGSRVWIPKACVEAIVSFNRGASMFNNGDRTRAVQHAAEALHHGVSSVGVSSNAGEDQQLEIEMDLVPTFERLLKTVTGANVGEGGSTEGAEQMQRCKVELARVGQLLCRARTAGLGSRIVSVLQLWWIYCSC